MPARHPGAVYGHSKGSAAGQKHRYRQVYTGGRWSEFLRHWRQGRLLEVCCCGASRQAPVRVDRDLEAPAVNLVADQVALPFSDRAFDTVACDPIYGLGMPQRIHLQRELSRVAARRLIFKATWIPRAAGWRLVETVLIAPETCGNVGVLSVLDRLADPGRLFAR